MLRSFYRPLCPVTLPFQGRQRYMHTFDVADPVMAEGFEDYLDPVKALCEAAGFTSGIAHMTVDEKTIDAGASQRRPRPHVDGCYVPAVGGWTHGSWSHEPSPGPGGPRRMPVIVASSVPGCRVWEGEFEGQPKEDGDLSHISDQLGAGEIVPAGVGYLLSPDCVHESMVFDRRVDRSFLRIALPVDFDVRRAA